MNWSGLNHGGRVQLCMSWSKSFRDGWKSSDIVVTCM